MRGVSLKIFDGTVYIIKYSNTLKKKTRMFVTCGKRMQYTKSEHIDLRRENDFF